MVEQVRYGLVGAGMMGAEHIRNLAITPGAVVTALAAPVAVPRNLARLRRELRREALRAPIDLTLLHYKKEQLMGLGLGEEAADDQQRHIPHATSRELVRCKLR